MDESKILFDLIKNDKFNEFKNIIEKSKETIDLNIRDNSGNYLITYAIIKNNKDIVQTLINNECKIDITDQEGRSILYTPIKYSYTDIIKQLIKYNKHSIGVSIADFKDKYNNIPLHYAIFFKNNDAIDLLVNDSNVNTVDVDGNNSLHLAIYSKDSNICKKIISVQNLNINLRTFEGETALHIACNYELEDIVKLLLENRIDINARDYDNQLTALMYTISLNNSKLSKLLLEYGADPNIQDYLGNTSVHHAVTQDSNEILYKMLSSPIKINVNCNIHNIDSKLPIHLFLEKEKIVENNIMKILIDQSNLNFQDNNNNTALHLICKNNIWQSYKEILKTKKLNIFIQNKEKKRPIDYVSESLRNEFMKMVASSYLYILRNYNFTWKEDWENICNKELFYNNLKPEELKVISKYVNKSDDVCYDIVMKKLNELYKNENLQCGNTSYPFKINKKCIDTISDIEKPSELCSFVGVTLDILCGLVYLLDKYKDACSTLTSNFINNDDLCNYYSNVGIKTSTKCEFLNFEIVWIYKKLFFSENFVENFKKCKTRFIIIPLGIELKNGSHANYLIYDRKINEIERFEPYGSEPPRGFNYDMDLLDNILGFKFSEIDSKIKYISPNKYLQKISFQYYDIYEQKTGKIGDPGGFCALWSIWYADNRLKYQEIDRKSLVKKLIKEIKTKNISFRNLIRNYSINITEIRDKVLSSANITINDWMNDQYTEKQYKTIIDELTKLLKKHIT
ncbi:ankyrin repeat protein [Indivirus ILV1]|uniref:Ankyrin repeat protein n=1 Tax=Indivirus ILV1 TaxID=1977633 RepID=A0A1V0SDT4_9VIRU|nr:ankyrin repeat protein [Indivirus ILV1]